MPLSDTFFTAAPHWGWLVILYFFFGGIAGGSYFIASLLGLFGNEADHDLARIGYYIAFPAVLICAPLLILDLTQPLRFWHMLIQNQTGWPMFKWWSAMSVGAWSLLVFGAFSFVSFIGALIESGRIHWTPPRALGNDIFRHSFNLLGTMAGFFLASYTGLLLSETNRPIWADTNLLGMLFLMSGASTGAALMMLFGRQDWIPARSRAWLLQFDNRVMALELVVLVAFIASLGAMAVVWLSVWGVLLVVGVSLVGILIPLALHWRPRSLGAATIPSAAVLALIGGFLLRVIVVFTSETV
jgi:protein NrfD